MIVTPTVLVLGAGASAPYGFPLGLGLLKDIQSELSKETDLKVSLDRSFEPKTVRGFIDTLQATPKMSIDAFLEKNPDDFKEIGKYAIAFSILRSEKSPAYLRESGRLRDDEDWYRVLYNLINAGPNIAENKLKIVTYNYDRSFEEFFARGLAADCCLSFAEAIPKVETLVLHLHGSVGPLSGRFEYGASTVPETVELAAKKIRIISEPQVGSDPVFQEAHGFLTTAERIYFLGFGYAEDNLRRLIPPGLKSKDKHSVIGTLRGFRGTEHTRLSMFLNAREFPIVFQDADCYSFLREYCFPSL